MEFVSPYQLFYNYNYAITRKQYWRVVTTFLYLGRLSLDWMLSVFFIVRNWRDLEEGSYLTRPADFAWMLMLMCAVLLAVSPYMGTLFLGNLLVTALTYVWSRHYSYMFLNIMGLFTISASYFPWCMIGFSLLVENRWPFPELVAIGVGHLFWFLSEEWPRRAESGGVQVLRAPKFLCRIMNQDTDEQRRGGFEESEDEAVVEDDEEIESEIADNPREAVDSDIGNELLHQRAPYTRETD
ncbi:hypothetical protein LPJ74_003335 [Coemansia sp. RSA 1843]|nr:hypothetical protein LPJ74_003335 [Coemansia sp. RSA 1843]